MQHLSNWIEIPVTDMARATAFYNTIFGGVAFRQMDMGELRYALFPTEDRFNAGALVQGDSYRPTTDGVTVYLNGGSDLSQILARVAEAGGIVVLEKTYLGEMAGHIGFFIDSEGNKLGLQHA